MLVRKGVVLPEGFIDTFVDASDYTTRLIAIFHICYWWGSRHYTVEENKIRIYNTQENIDSLCDAVFDQKTQTVNQEALKYIIDEFAQVAPLERTQESFDEFWQQTCKQAISMNPSSSLKLK